MLGTYRLVFVPLLVIVIASCVASRECADAARRAAAPQATSCDAGLRVRFRGVRSPRRSHLKPNPHGRLWICPPDLPDCDPREAIGSEVVAKRKRAEAFEAHFFVKTGVSIPEGAWLVIRLADARLKLRTKRWGTVGASDFRIGTARARFEEPLELQHDNFSARVTCLRGG